MTNMNSTVHTHHERRAIIQELTWRVLWDSIQVMIFEKCLDLYSKAHARIYVTVGGRRTPLNIYRWTRTILLAGRSRDVTYQ